ncbi:MAG: DM13 domain-containing protein [Anaerolineae bacterium]|nr:DM13 domain-containing protein [Anaerolineae bacterium]MDQ7035052.1 DM13 domain-containing protein [Anaerolineae bacterium]
MDTRFRVAVITLAGLLAAAVWALPFWWTVLNPESIVAVGLPGLTIEERADYATLADNLQRAYELIYDGEEDSEIPAQPDWALALVRARFSQTDRLAAESATVFEAPPGSQAIETGEFASIDSVRWAEGELTIYQNPNGTRLLHLAEDFRSARAPEIHIILTRNPDPMDERGVGVDYIDIGILRGNVGQQSYTIPPSVDFNRYPMLVLYAPQYDAILATATLQ